MERNDCQENPNSRKWIRRKGPNQEVMRRVRLDERFLGRRKDVRRNARLESVIGERSGAVICISSDEDGELLKVNEDGDSETGRSFDGCKKVVVGRRNASRRSVIGGRNVEVIDVSSDEGEELGFLGKGNAKQNARQLMEWKPRKDRGHNVLVAVAPSLVDLSLEVLADNAETIVSLDGVSDELKRRLCDLLFDSRKMSAKALDLFVRGSPTELRIKNCSWLAQNVFQESFRGFDPKNLEVLQLDQGAKCPIYNILAEILAQFSSSLSNLVVISLRAAYRLCDDDLGVLVKLVPSLRSINLGRCPLLTCGAISIIGKSLGSSLRELFIDYCDGIRAWYLSLVLEKFVHLEVLSVAGIPDMRDRYVIDIITATALGKSIKDLDLADCGKLTDISMEIIGRNCSQLRALNIANLHKLTNSALSHLSVGCKSIQKLKLGGNNFSDEAIAAFLKESGEFLVELSLKQVFQVHSSTALSLAKYSQRLMCLNLSRCPKVTDEILGFILDSCLSLRVLKLTGFHQINELFLNGQPKSRVRILGLKASQVSNCRSSKCLKYPNS